MLQRRQNLALLQKPGLQRRTWNATAEKLDRDALLHLAIGALGEKNLAHAATTEQALQPVRAAAKPWRGEFFERFEEGLGGAGDGLGYRRIRRIEPQERLQFRSQLRGDLAPLKITGAFRGSQIVHLAEQSEDLVFHGSRHDGTALSGSRSILIRP